MKRTELLVAVIDGQGGGMGRALTEAVKILLPSQRCSIRLAVGPAQPLQYYLDDAMRLLDEEVRRLTA